MLYGNRCSKHELAELGGARRGRWIGCAALCRGRRIKRRSQNAARRHRHHHNRAIVRRDDNGRSMPVRWRSARYFAYLGAIAILAAYRRWSCLALLLLKTKAGSVSSDTRSVR